MNTVIVYGPCEVCGWCPHCKRGLQHELWWYEKYFPEHAKRLKEHFEIYPEHDGRETCGEG
jgi:thiol-disulfide isomerase/thioredoxin